MNTKTILGPLVVATCLAIPAVAHAERCSDGSYSVHHLRAPTTEQADAPSLDDDCIERNIFFMPGVAGVFFQPAQSLGPFYGAGVQLSPYQWSHNNDRFGPSQGGVYMQASLLSSSRSSGTLALFEVGATASIERNASRRFLIPYFGGAVGGVSQSELGSSAYAYPMGGLHLYWHRNLMLDAEGGYHFPFSDIDRARGPRAQLTARLSMW